MKYYADFQSGRIIPSHLELQQKGIHPGTSILTIVWIILAISCFTLTAQAQSGRKIPKPSTPPETTKQPEPEETKPAAKNEVPKIPMLVSYYTQYINIPRSYSEFVAESCAARLKESDIEIQMNKEMNRKEASDAAKKSDATYVVLIQLGVDSFNSSSANMGVGYVDPRTLFVEYTAFEPKTGKVRANGRVYQRRTTNDPLSLPQSTAAAEQRLRRAGEEAADRILSSLNLPVSPPHR